MKRTHLALLSFAALAPIGVALADATIVVNQSHRSFSVRDLRVKLGTVVHFTNTDEFIHHLYVDSPAMKFNSGEQPPGREVDIPFSVTGTFEVRCEIHPRMLLTVVVE